MLYVGYLDRRLAVAEVIIQEKDEAERRLALKDGELAEANRRLGLLRAEFEKVRREAEEQRARADGLEIQNKAIKEKVDKFVAAYKANRSQQQQQQQQQHYY